MAVMQLNFPITFFLTISKWCQRIHKIKIKKKKLYKTNEWKKLLFLST